MLTLDEHESNDNPIALIMKDTGKLIDLLYIKDPNLRPTRNKNKRNNSFNELGLDPGEHFEQCPSEAIRCIYIAASSGSGKSTYAGRYILKYLMINRGAKLFLFSLKPEDPALDYLNPIRIRIDDSLIDEPIELSEIEEGSIILFDDCDNVISEKVKKSLQNIQKQILEMGRQMKIQILITSHLINPSGTMGRILMNECQSLTIFPWSGASHQIKYCLEKYFDFDKKSSSLIANSSERWITITKAHPSVILTEMNCVIKKNFISGGNSKSKSLF